MIVIEEVDARTWFGEIGVDSDAGPEVQEAVAQLVVEQLRDGAHRAELVSELYPKNRPPGALGMMVTRTNIYLRVSGITMLRLQIAAALLADFMTSSPVVGVGSAFAATVFDNVRRLDDSELRMLAQLRRLARPGSLYETWVAEGDLASSWAWGDDLETRKLLAQMKARGILEEGAGLWRAVR